MAAGSGGRGLGLDWFSLVRPDLLRYGIASEGVLIIILVFTHPVVRGPMGVLTQGYLSELILHGSIARTLI